MSYLDRVQACNRLDLRGMKRFRIANEDVGWISAARADVLVRYPEVFEVSDDAVTLAPALTTPPARASAIAAIAPKLVASGAFHRLRDELYAVKAAWASAPLFTLDRALVPGFGVRAYGVHVNGFVRRDGKLHLWIGTRAMNREIEPGKLDNMVAGGQPAHLSLFDNLIKECGEEAGLEPALARAARPTGVISYAFTSAEGVKADTLFCYDLEMPAGHEPRNSDGEITRFELMPLDGVLDLIRETTRFKFNVNLVILDFAIRHGCLDPDREPDFEHLIAGLHCRPRSEFGYI